MEGRGGQAAETEAEKDISYALYEGKFVRSIALPERDCSAEELARALSEYIQTFDSLMKGYLTGRLGRGEVDESYGEYMKGRSLFI